MAEKNEKSQKIIQVYSVSQLNYLGNISNFC